MTSRLMGEAGSVDLLQHLAVRGVERQQPLPFATRDEEPAPIKGQGPGAAGDSDRAQHLPGLRVDADHAIAESIGHVHSTEIAIGHEVGEIAADIDGPQDGFSAGIDRDHPARGGRSDEGGSADVVHSIRARLANQRIRETERQLLLPRWPPHRPHPDSGRAVGLEREDQRPACGGGLQVVLACAVGTADLPCPLAVRVLGLPYRPFTALG